MLSMILTALLDPTTASVVASLLVAEPSLAPELLAICKRESHCRMIGVHEGDLGGSSQAWKNAVRVGWLRPDECAFHQEENGPWSTSGPWGTYRAYTMHHVGACFDPKLLDVPLFGGIATALRMQSACEKYNACDQDSRRRLWGGAALVDERVAKRRKKAASAVPWRS